jgi:hypothetical protein
MKSLSITAIALALFVSLFTAPAAAENNNPWEYQVVEELISGELQPSEPSGTSVWKEVEPWVNWSITTNHPEYGTVSAHGIAYADPGKKYHTFSRVELRRLDTNESNVVVVEEGRVDLVSKEVTFGNAISFAQIWKAPWGVYDSGMFYPFRFEEDKTMSYHEWSRLEDEAWEAFLKSYKK